MKLDLGDSVCLAGDLLGSLRPRLGDVRDRYMIKGGLFGPRPSLMGSLWDGLWDGLWNSLEDSLRGRR